MFEAWMDSYMQRLEDRFHDGIYSYKDEDDEEDCDEEDANWFNELYSEEEAIV